MILEFSIQNFRSIKEKQVFSMLAGNAKSKTDNIFEVTLANGEKLTLTKSAVIYGANASGKSNLVRAFKNLINFITESSKIEIAKPIIYYDPFLFDESSSVQPVAFEIIFIAENNLKYHYSLCFNAEEIETETLYYYPKKKKQNLFTRSSDKKSTDPNLHIGRLSKNLKYKEYHIHKKLPLLSLFGKAENYHELISGAYSYFNGISVMHNMNHIKFIRETVNLITETINRPINVAIKQKIDQLIKVADTKIEEIIISKNEDSTTKPTLFGRHPVYDIQGKQTGSRNLPFGEESAGTNMLFLLGAFIIITLEKGGVVIVDELDTSLHPHLSRFLVRLFHHPVSNTSNAQLIFTTHEANLLDKDMFRADQIWFAEKNKFGATEIFSAQDFEGVREDIPFDKWYLAGKFGAVPHIDEIEFIFGDGKGKEKTQD